MTASAPRRPIPVATYPGARAGAPGPLVPPASFSDTARRVPPTGRDLRQEREAISRFHAAWVGAASLATARRQCPPLLMDRPTKRCMLGALATWTAHDRALISVPVCCTRAPTCLPWVTTPMRASSRTRGLHHQLAWTLIGGWGGLRPSGSWALGLTALLGPLRLDDACPGATNRLVLCGDLYFQLATRAPPYSGHPRTRGPHARSLRARHRGRGTVTTRRTPGSFRCPATPPYCL